MVNNVFCALCLWLCSSSLLPLVSILKKPTLALTEFQQACWNLAVSQKQYFTRQKDYHTLTQVRARADRNRRRAIRVIDRPFVSCKVPGPVLEKGCCPAPGPECFTGL